MRLEKGAEKAAQELEKCNVNYHFFNQLPKVSRYDLNYIYLNLEFYFCFYADDPNSDPNISGDPYKTLFVARLVSNIYRCTLYSMFLVFGSSL